MPNVRRLVRRIETVRSLAQVTKAMELISASRMRRAQDRALAARPYAQKLQQVLEHLAAAASKGADEEIHPFLRERPVSQVAIVVVASDRGLCGGYNANVVRAALGYEASLEARVRYVTVGRRAREAILGAGGQLMADFPGLPVNVTLGDAAPIARLLESAYLAGEIDAAAIAYTRFASTMAQVPAVLPILPFGRDRLAGGKPGPAIPQFIYEPEARLLLEYLLPHAVEIAVLSCLLEAAASEHSARMVAMRNATENANEMGRELVRLFNRLRQERITNEILDIAGATEAVTTLARQAG